MNSQEYRKKILFIDDAYVLETDNVRRTTNQAVKYGQPIIRMDAPWDTPDDEFGGLNVVYDPQDKLFKMWYGVLNRMVDWGGGTYLTAYATSSDGIHWEKPILNMVEHKGSKENNYVTPADLEGFSTSIIIDPSEPPVRRFKMIFTSSNIYNSGRVTDWARHHSPLNLAYSEDGLRWDRPVFVNPVLRGISDDVHCFFYDEDRRKYQLFTRRVPNLPRDISLYESFDLTNWEDCGRVFVAGDEKDPPTLYNIHGITVLRYDTYRLGLLNTMYLHPRSEGLGVFQTPPPDYPYKDEIGLLDLQLGFSIDGRNWRRADDRSPVVPVGQGDAPDAGMLFPQMNSPIVVDGDTYIYYSGWRCRHTAWSQKEIYDQTKRDARQTACGMLAIMPEDHWVSFDAGPEGGSLLAGPWELPQRMFVNADAQGGSIEVEFLDGYEKPLPGLSRADCIPITGKGKDQQVRWKGDPSPADLKKQDYLCGVLARIYLKNAKLYSCTLVHPDPEGTMRRYWANYKWNENIFHRSGQWDRASNAPAGGLPPVTRGALNY